MIFAAVFSLLTVVTLGSLTFVQQILAMEDYR